MIPKLRGAGNETRSLVQTLCTTVPSLGNNDDLPAAPLRKPSEGRLHQARASSLAMQVISDAHQPDLADTAFPQVTGDVAAGPPADV